MGKKWLAVLCGAAVGLAVGVAVTIALCAQGWRLQPEVWGTFAQWASAIGSTCAVIVAIWGERLRRFALNPQLKLELTNPNGVKVLTRKVGADGVPVMPTEAIWLHVAVSNPKRWFQAKEAQVYLLRVEQKQFDDWVEVWTGPAPLHWRNDDVVHKSLGPSWDADVLVINEKTLQFTTRKGDPNLAFNHAVELRAVLQARSLEMDSEPLTIQILWPGVAPEVGGVVQSKVISIVQSK